MISATVMHDLVKGCQDFIGDLDGWDTSAGKNTRAMFMYTEAFTGAIESWDMSAATDASCPVESRPRPRARHPTEHPLRRAGPRNVPKLHELRAQHRSVGRCERHTDERHLWRLELAHGVR